MIPTSKHIAAALGVFVLATAIVAFTMLALFGAGDRRFWLAGSVLGTGLGTLLAIEVTGWSVRHIVATARPSPRVVAPLLAIAAGTMLVQGGILLIASTVVDIDAPNDTLELFQLRGLSAVGVVVAAVLVAPVVEELFVRGVLLRASALRFGWRAGLLGTSAIFGLLHWNAAQTPMTFVSGLVWGAILLRTGNLADTIALHMLNNAIVSAVAIAATIRGVVDAPPAEAQTPVLASLIIGSIVVAVGAGTLRAGFRHLPRDPERLARLWGVPLDLVLGRTTDGASAVPTSSADTPEMAAAPPQPATFGQP
jgi:membrane protease YdiL (CAAX protease family)